MLPSSASTERSTIPTVLLLAILTDETGQCEVLKVVNALVLWSLFSIVLLTGLESFKRFLVGQKHQENLARFIQVPIELQTGA